MIADQFSSRTLANMEVALEQACKCCPPAPSENRRYIALRILKCAEGGDTGLGLLIEAATRAANELGARGTRAGNSGLKAQKR